MEYIEILHFPMKIGLGVGGKAGIVGKKAFFRSSE